MNKFKGGRAAVINTRIGFFQNHHAASFDTGVIGFHGRGHKIGKTHIGDKTAAFLNLQDGFFPFLPFRHADTAGKHAGVHADIRQRFGERERTSPYFAVLTRFGRHAAGHIVITLFRRALFMDRRKRQITGQT